VLTPGERALLVEACRTADELGRLEKAVRALPELTVEGSTGQPRAHPLFAEVRAHRQLLERLTSALALPDVDEEVGAGRAQKHAKRAAAVRWRSRKENEHGEAS
jgi:hypothetical protein